MFRIEYILSFIVLESLLLALYDKILYSHSNNSNSGSFYHAGTGLSIKVYLHRPMQLKDVYMRVVYARSEASTGHCVTSLYMCVSRQYRTIDSVCRLVLSCIHIDTSTSL